MPALIWIVSVGVVGALFVVALRRYHRVTETRVITCPETGHREAVHLDPVHRVGHALLGHDDMRLQSCSRWPERADCDQPCRSQIASAPDGCRVRTLLDTFYAGQTCVACHHPVGAAADWAEHVPGLLLSDGKVAPWNEVPARELDTILASAQPLCWNCTQVGRVEQEHPELVTIRPARKWEAVN